MTQEDPPPPRTDSPATSVVLYTSTDQIRYALEASGIGCEDFPASSPEIAACSMSDWTPDPGLTVSVVVLFASAEDAANAIHQVPCGEADLLYRDGQLWLATISHVADDRVTNTDIVNQRFIAKVASLLGTDLVDCPGSIVG
jgi:hypothetical protein